MVGGATVFDGATAAMPPPPLRQLPINVPTRGPTPSMQQVGILTDGDNGTILALYGRPTFRGSSKWVYFTATDKFQSIRLPVWRMKRNCTDDLGCDELYDGDEATVPAYAGKQFKTTLYSLDAPRYIPYL